MSLPAVTLFYSFRSPYSWLAVRRLQRIELGADLRFFAVFPPPGMTPASTSSPRRLAYTRDDATRVAAAYGLHGALARGTRHRVGAPARQRVLGRPRLAAAPSSSSRLTRRASSAAKISATLRCSRASPAKPASTAIPASPRPTIRPVTLRSGREWPRHRRPGSSACRPSCSTASCSGATIGSSGSYDVWSRLEDERFPTSRRSRWRRSASRPERDRRAAEVRLGLAALLLLYCASAALLVWLVRPGGRRASPLAALFLCLLPLAYTATGFLKERTLAPTRMFVGVAPWADPELVARAAEGASATNPVLLDPVSQMIPWSRAARDDLLFNPAQGAGAALLGNGQSAVLFPTEVASRLLAPFRAVTYSQAARLLLAAWGMFVLIRLAGSASSPRARRAPSTWALDSFNCGDCIRTRWSPRPRPGSWPPRSRSGAGPVRDPPRCSPSRARVGVAGGHPETLLHVMVFAALTVPRSGAANRTLLDATRVADPSPGLGSGLGGPRVPAGRADTAALRREPPGFGRMGRSTPARAHRHRSAAAHRARAAAARRRAARARRSDRGHLARPREPRRARRRSDRRRRSVPGGARRERWTPPRATMGAARDCRGRSPRSRSSARTCRSCPLRSAWCRCSKDTLLKRLALWWVLAVAILAAAAIDALRDAAARSRRLADRRRRRGDCSRRSRSRSRSVTRHRPSGLECGSPRACPSSWRSIATALIASTRRRADTTRRARFGAGVALLLCALVLPRLWLFARWIPATPPEGFYRAPPSLNVVHPAAARSAASRLPRHRYRSGAAAALRRILRSRGDPLLRPDGVGYLPSLPQRRDRAGHDPGRACSTLAFPCCRSSACVSCSRTRRRRCRPIRAWRGSSKPQTRRRREDFSRSGLLIAYEGPDAVLWERGDALPRAFFPRAWRIESADRALPSRRRSTTSRRSPSSTAGRARRSRHRAAESAEIGVDRPNPPAEVLALEVGRGTIDVEVDASADSILATSQPAIPGWRLTIDDAPRAIACAR